MTETSEATIGATAEDQINKGEPFSRTFSYQDDDGVAIDMTGAAFEISESYPSSIVSDMTITETNLAGGVITLSMTVAQMANLGLGRVNWFRLKTTFNGGAVDTTPKIWVQIT